MYPIYFELTLQLITKHVHALQLFKILYLQTIYRIHFKIISKLKYIFLYWQCYLKSTFISNLSLWFNCFFMSNSWFNMPSVNHFNFIQCVITAIVNTTYCTICDTCFYFFWLRKTEWRHLFTQFWDNPCSEPNLQKVFYKLVVNDSVL